MKPTHKLHKEVRVFWPTLPFEICSLIDEELWAKKTVIWTELKKQYLLELEEKTADLREGKRIWCNGVALLGSGLGFKKKWTRCPPSCGFILRNNYPYFFGLHKHMLRELREKLNIRLPFFSIIL
jgi:hypothetical protein